MEIRGQAGDAVEASIEENTRVRKEEKAKNVSADVTRRTKVKRRYACSSDSTKE